MVSVRALLMGPGFGNEHPVVQGAGGLGLSLVPVAWAQFPLQQAMFSLSHNIFSLSDAFLSSLWFLLRFVVSKLWAFSNEVFLKPRLVGF